MSDYRVGELVTVKDQLFYTLPMTPETVVEVAERWGGVPTPVLRRAKRELRNTKIRSGFTLWLPVSVATSASLLIRVDSRRHPVVSRLPFPQVGVVVRSVPFYDVMPGHEALGAGFRECSSPLRGYHVAYRLDEPPLAVLPSMMERRQ